MIEPPKIITITLPEYSIDEQPDYEAVGSKIDQAIVENFNGTYLARGLSRIDHPQYTIDQLVDIIVTTGTDKYDPNRKGVAHEEFAPYKPDLQAWEIVTQNGKLLGESFSEDVRRFYENTLIDRGYRLRIDLIVLYDPAQMVKAEKSNTSGGLKIQAAGQPRSKA
jgi:hypothetical protein